jgi:3-oxoacyl-[acyl-carrier protein] reductase
VSLLEGKVALVTGGARGIGKAIVEALSGGGATVAFTYKSSVATAEKFAGELRAKGRTTYAYQSDAASLSESAKVVEQVVSDCGRLDILVNNAGITRDRLLIRMTEQDWDEVIDTNLKSAFNYCKAASRPMIAQRRGKIVNVASISGVMGNAGQANYSAAKSGMIGLTKTIAKELAPRNIQVNAVAPGLVATDMMKDVDVSQLEGMTSIIPMKLIAQPEEIAELVVFFASPASDYVTGQVLPGQYD